MRFQWWQTVLLECDSNLVTTQFYSLKHRADLFHYVKVQAEIPRIFSLISCANLVSTKSTYFVFFDLSISLQ